METHDHNSKPRNYCDININNLHSIGKGRQGIVYRLPENKVLKVFYNIHSCKDQLLILQHSKDSKFFPKVYAFDEYSIIIDYISGQPLKEYLQNSNINEKISFELVELINEFKSLGFTRLDIRLAHIFVQKDFSIKIIDPRRNFSIIQPYPLQMLRGLKKTNALEKFFSFIKYKYNDEYTIWEKQIKLRT